MLRLILIVKLKKLNTKDQLLIIKLQNKNGKLNIILHVQSVDKQYAVNIQRPASLVQQCAEGGVKEATTLECVRDVCGCAGR
ncbi:jg16031 [Pararge aegeria aegeria]|uniref:Jg16031 protein n=1 Tax=Pararge aegeria aegeria TaxID=348720 RepID=A0A8S4SPH2_9NEOP|nr:jg16031 [Pararge aegeria aegeria]